MIPISAISAAGLLALSLPVSAIVLWLIGRRLREDAKPVTAPDPDADSLCEFLFHDGFLADHHAGIPEDTDCPLTSWSEIRAWFAARFPGLPECPTGIPEGGEHRFLSCSPGDSATLCLSRKGNDTRLVLVDPQVRDPATRHEILRLRQMADNFRRILEQAPAPVLKTDRDGTLLWHNAAFGHLADGDRDALRHALATADCREEQHEQRVNGTTRSYTVTTSTEENAIIGHAHDISALIRAESAQRDFVQTLAKTFAHLSTGLAVFDRNRQLVLFNPALVDLTSLPAEFLSNRPHLMGFFDRLRDQQVMPEPRNYADWKSHVNEVTERASDGLYEETWTLPDDLTYRITGRPHPDGAIAFLFEDITAEVHLARRFRSQLDLRQAALDALPDPVTIFGPDGILAFCNKAAMEHLHIDPESSFADMSTADLLAVCKSRFPDALTWTKLEPTLIEGTARDLRDWNDTASGDQTIRILLRDLPGGARMMILKVAAAMDRPLPA
ncbi:hypothetical protein DQW77_01245 [Roseovarius sp. TE539]|uniref:PAS-domain containing protein n=1 Tax=Roseovarius sp. TE539 TaxID=2249812 RepID=UPI000DDCD1C1|nr:PAS-domain containing protein [Roseovarius sp. TE539]RBI77649.1 hypothetical protein DQW77_01245 [Roseovarius sp. TE539]